MAISDYDVSVAKQAYATAIGMGASPKVLLALFEAGIVESNFHNYTVATDHDSLGYLQQRPSQGWPDPTNVTTATRSFVNKARLIEGNYSNPADLAQAVQRSAFPARYGQNEANAKELLAHVSGAPDGSAAVPGTLTGFSVPGLDEVKKILTNLSDARMWERVGYLVIGIALVIIAGYMLVKQTSIGQVVGKASGQVAKVTHG